ncbi:MAG TPA: hypothetical protein VHD83_11520, partial [Puia sp.]|nr:hypothetical protein [Puia sp.]
MQMPRTYSNRWMILLLSLFVINSARGGDGGGVVKAMAVLDGSLHQIKVDSSRTVEDSAFFNPAYVSNLDTAYSVQNIVTVKINEASTVYLHDSFTCNVQLRIYYTVGTSTVDSIDRGFMIRYDSASAYNARNSFVFYGARKVTVKVLSVTSSVSTWDPVKALMVENLLVTRPKFLFSCTNTVTDITVTPVADTADELPVSWTAVLGADQYDLEWTYIDSSALRTPGRYPDVTKVFLNNASRASVSGTSYRIPLMYDDTGVVYIRVRPVQVGAANAVTAAEWSSEASTPVMGSYTFSGHQPSMNWQSNISYAEEGKRKVVVQYFDGSLRSRQTVTKDNTTNTTIVAETYYDYQGRPAIQVMPSPTLNTVIQYTAGFNVSVNGAEYSQSNYDSLPGMASVCDAHADPMDTTTGASAYYSTNNPSKTIGMNQFIPDAKKYPFTETEYTPDNTGRISRQGGVGPDHQLGSGHETKYFYGTPDQDELDGLFGTEVGDHTHYFKNMVRDANGQYSVSYVDMHGRTIATALTGNTPEHLTALPSNTSYKVTDNLLDSNAVATIQDLSMISQKGLLVPVADTFNFHYRLTPDVFSEMNCNDHPVCYTCLYDLEIIITDDCSGNVFDTVVNNFHISDSCSPSAFSVDFSRILPEGSYLITKKLTVDRDSYNSYLNNVYLPGNTCTNLTQYISRQDSINAASTGQCTPDCASCRSAVGDWPTFWTNFRTHAGIPDADTAAYKTEAMTAYQNALSACDDLCNSNQSDANDIRKAMLQDLTPPFGQYADTTKRPSDDIYSIFYQRANDTSFTPVYKLPGIVYKDDNGNPDMAFNAQSNIMVNPNTLTVAQFVQAFRPSWAESLLPYHPEYCKLLAMEAQDSSNKWDRYMESIEDYQTAYDQGFLNPTGRDPVDKRSPFGYFAFITATGQDPLITSPLHRDMQSKMWDEIYHYWPPQGGVPELSMWTMAVVMTKCPGGDNACILKYADAGHVLHQDVLNEMCTADKDMAWRNFRQMYLEAKHSLNFQHLIDGSPGCTPTDTRAYGHDPTAQQIYAAKHTPEFADSHTSLDYNGMGSLSKVAGKTGAEDATATANDSLQQAYAQNIQALEQQWRQQLTTCKLYSSVD